MDPTIKKYMDRQDELVADSRTTMAAADAENRDLTDDELDAIRENTGEYKRMQKLIDARQEVLDQEDELSRPQGRQTDHDDVEPDDGDPIEPDPEPTPAAGDRERAPRARREVTVPRERGSRGPVPAEARRGNRVRPDHGFNSFGQFVSSVRNASIHGGELDGRLLAAAATTFGNEGAGADGGFLVPPEFRQTILDKALSADSLIARTDQQVVSGNSLTFPTDMTTPWGSTGIQAYWEGEAATYTQTKPDLQNIMLRLHKLTALVPVTEELLEDAPAMGSYVARKAGEKIDFKVSNSIAYGTGAGQPLGFMNSDVLVTQDAETQTADTIVAANVVKMLSRMPVRGRRNAVWLIHPDAEPQLPLMTIGDQPVYLPPGGIRNDPFGSLLGRPVIPHEVCQTVGDLGDIMLCDFTQYLTAIKAGGIRAQTSIHLWFDQDLTAFKFTFRLAGQPWWSEVTTSNNGTHTMSPFITLAARA